MLPNDAATTGQVSFNVGQNRIESYNHFDMDEYKSNLDPFLKSSGRKSLIFNSGAKATSFSSYSEKAIISNMKDYCEDVARDLGYSGDSFWPAFRPLWDADKYHTEPFISGVEMWQAINGRTFYVYQDGVPVVIADGLSALKENYRELLPFFKVGYVYCVQTG